MRKYNWVAIPSLAIFIVLTRQPVTLLQLNIAYKHLVDYMSLNIGSPDKIEAEFENLARSPSASRAAWGWGILKTMQGDTKQAATLWAESSHSTQDLIRLTELYLYRWQVDQARVAFTALQRRDSTSSCGWYYAGFLDRKQWRLKLANAALEQAIALDNFDDCPHLWANAYAQSGLVAHKNGNLAKAEIRFEQALAIAKDIDAEVGLAELDFAEGNHQASFERLQALLIEYPDSTKPLVALYKIQLSLGDNREALQVVEAAINIAPDYHILYYYRANAHIALENYAQAVADYQRAILTEPGNGNYYLGLGKALLGLSKTEQAITALCKVLKIDPSKMSANTVRQAQELLEQLEATHACSEF